MNRRKKKKAKRGNCYVVCEALYHLMGGKRAGYIPHRLRHEGDTHWYLVQNHNGHPVIIDPTVKQFRRKPDYSKGVGCGFLTKKPSKRAREMMKKLVWQ